MTGEPTHTISKERMAPALMFFSERVPQLSITLESEVAIMLRFQLCSACYAALRTVGEVPLQSIQSPWKTLTIPVYKCGKAITRYTVN